MRAFSCNVGATMPKKKSSKHHRLSDEVSAPDDAPPDGAPPDGMKEEVARRLRYCEADYGTAWRYASKTISAALFMFFATLFSTVALGAHLQQSTHGRIGLAEYLTMNSIAGFAHSVLGVQPLLVLRPTGPITAILGKLSTLADTQELDFFALLAATGACVGLNMLAIAWFRLSRHARRCTPFTLEIFTCFVCSIYVHDGASDVYRRFNKDASVEGFAVSLLDANLAILTFALAVKLAGARAWSYLHPAARGWIADYAVTIAVIAGTAASYGALEDVAAKILHISLPSQFSPTCLLSAKADAKALANAAAEDDSTRTCIGGDAISHPTWDDVGGGERRPWLVPNFVPPAELFGARLWLTALACAVPISFFFYMDQNISRLACEACEGGTARGGSYQHASFVALGLLNAVATAFGLPFVTGSLPHSPQLVKALTVRRADGSIDRVAESRVAPILVYLLIGLPLFAPHVLKVLPEAVIDGVLAYVGYEGIASTLLFERCLLVVTPKREYPPRFGRPSGLRARTVRRYTALQLGMLALCWAVNLSRFGLGVAFVVVSLVPLRERVLPRLFAAADLAALDAPVAPAAPKDYPVPGAPGAAASRRDIEASESCCEAAAATEGTAPAPASGSAPAEAKL